MNKITLGSLFDGIGGFILAGEKIGIKTVWASEVDPDCIAITKKHFPYVEHLGDIRQLDGKKLHPVDIVTFGSPCQGLSIAGKRDGLLDYRSILFYDAIRVIREMRIATKGDFPKFALWENVPGAFTSNKGEDFRFVLEEFIDLATDVKGEVKHDKKTKRKVSVPRPNTKYRKWKKAGVIMGRDYSIAWRQLDAQFWGVPQRRKRIFLVLDFRGQSAPEILFKPEELQSSFDKGRKEGSTNTSFIERSFTTSI